MCNKNSFPCDFLVNTKFFDFYTNTYQQHQIEHLPQDIHKVQGEPALLHQVGACSLIQTAGFQYLGIRFCRLLPH